MTGIGFRVSSKQGASAIPRFVALNRSQIQKASTMPSVNNEQYRTQGIGWLRARMKAVQALMLHASISTAMDNHTETIERYKR